MGNRLPEYSLNDILHTLAMATLHGIDSLDDDQFEILNNVANDWYILEDKND